MLFKVSHVMENLQARGIDLNATGGIELLTEVLRQDLSGLVGWSCNHITDELTVEVLVASDGEETEALQKLSAYGQVEAIREVLA
ncbi:hypothetical protein Desku_1094 [Desulfofundulus kuznetsovii DSM 6115]|uniref:Uncharacterized protein n=1 Tax=Desulfofundulus kuznetsovii (strain DSM 6115 / VKM B-1805 / 17) TaxID=760568 RepID=A0AAU8PSE5_DESK7|nr:hypothetical protein Desku_1094 [Desulfofundulus kuznetsovii DSM 6115]